MFTSAQSGHIFERPDDTVIEDFAVGAGGWSSQDQFPRHVADVNGDGYADIVGFGLAGVFVSYNSPFGFRDPVLVLNEYGLATGWTSNEAFPRFLADVNADGRADIVAFGRDYGFVSLATDTGFAPIKPVIADMVVSKGWTLDRNPRVMADINRDGRADAIGFGQSGVIVQVCAPDGVFISLGLVVNNFGVAQGWTSDDRHHREVADVDGDGLADIVGFGDAGVWVALNDGNGGFGEAMLALDDFGRNSGWLSQDRFPRHVVDVNGDGIGDIVGFGAEGVLVAYGSGDGTFGEVEWGVEDFSLAQGWSSDNIYHRELADVDGNSAPDLVGFGEYGMLVGFNLNGWWILGAE